MKNLLLLLLLGALPALGQSVVQDKQCNSSTTPATCAFTSSVTSGNYLFVVVATGNSTNANVDCTNNVGGTYSDSLGTTMTRLTGATNFGGFTDSVCIVWGRFGSSGADTVSYATSGAMMYLAEVTSIPTASVDSTAFNNALGNGNTTVSTGTATASVSTNFIICAVSNNNTNPFTSATPAGGTLTTTTTASFSAAFLYQFTGSAGSQSCVFSIPSGATRPVAVVGVIKYSTTAKRKRRRSQVY